MKTAIVTGASSGIGLAISKKLLQLGFQVHGLSRNIDRSGIADEKFIKHSIDIRDTKKVQAWTKKVIETSDSIDVLVNNAGVGFFAPHEEISVDHITQMVETNLLAPMLMTQLFLRELKKSKGFVIQIASVTALESSSFGCTYSATKAGLRQFGSSLFEETRKSGVKVVTLFPDMTKTHFFDHQNFTTEDAPDAHILPECIANAVENILTQRDGTIITEMTIRPQKLQIKKKKSG